MSIPADLRRELEAGDVQFPATQIVRMKIVYGRHLKGHLQAYAMDDFAKISANINKMKRGSVERRRAAQLILASSVTIEVDRDGRIVLPKERREQIGLEGEVRYIGLGEYFEIWNKADTEEQFDDLDAWLDEMGDDFDPLTLVPDMDVGEEE